MSALLFPMIPQCAGVRRPTRRQPSVIIWLMFCQDISGKFRVQWVDGCRGMEGGPTINAYGHHGRLPPWPSRPGRPPGLRVVLRRRPLFSSLNCIVRRCAPYLVGMPPILSHNAGSPALTHLNTTGQHAWVVRGILYVPGVSPGLSALPSPW